MAPPQQSLWILSAGACIAASITAYGRGILFAIGPEGVVLVLLATSPLALLSWAAFVGQRKKAGRGAVGFMWLFLVFEALLVWNATVVPRKGTDAIGLALLIFVQVLVALAILLAAVLQKPERDSDAGKDVT
jgi:apolipoprotein N-acyltransferase